MRTSLKYILVLVLLLLPSIGWRASAQYDKDVFYYRGRLALSDGKFSEAIENFNILARLDTTDHLTFFFRGIAKYNLGDLRGAHSDFNTSVRLNPIFTSGYHYRAITLSRFGRYDEALADLQQAVNLRPGLTGLYFSRGVTYFLAQQFDKAVSDFDYYIRKEPKDPSAYLNRGASHLFLGDTLKAFNDYNKAIKLDRFDPEGFVRRGRLYAIQGNYDKAIADMNKAIELDPTNTLAYFNRALMYYETKDYNAAMADLNRVLKDEPGNALTLYNRGLIHAQLGNYREALADLDRVLNINPENVLAYFNRASVFIEMERYDDAIEDYDRAIELYPDFAKAYMNRSYVKNMIGDMKGSKQDYQTARKKVAEYRSKSDDDPVSLADTTKKYSSLLALDAEFAKKDFNDELLQHRDIDIRLRPLYKFVITQTQNSQKVALSRSYENPLLKKFESDLPLAVTLSNGEEASVSQDVVEEVIYGDVDIPDARINFLRALNEAEGKRYNSALSYYDSAVSSEGTSSLSLAYRAFYLMNRGVLRADVIEFMSALDYNVQVLTMDESKTTKARVKDRVSQQYDYSEAIADMQGAAVYASDIPYIYYNLGNLYCLSSEHLSSIENYTKAIELYPYLADAYFNRGLVLIYLRDKEKGCIDLSRAGELGIKDAYAVIKKYCESEVE